MYRAGFLGVIGQPNAGKSSLVNFLVREKVSIVSAKPQTTRRRVLGLWSAEEGQVVFVDAPGVIDAESGLNGFLAQEAKDVIDSSDALVAVVSVDEKSKDDALKVIEMVSQAKKPWVGVITKTDLVEKVHRVLAIKEMIESRGGKALQVSVKNNDEEDREALLLEFLQLLPESPQPLFDIELFTTENTRDLAEEIIREKIFENVEQELPYSMAVRIIKFEENAKPCPKIFADIIVAKENHKAMVIGKKAEVLKTIGMSARKEIEKMMGEKIYLELNVQYRENWHKNKRMMKELGYVLKSEDV